MIVRVGEAVAVAEFVQQRAEAEAALIEAVIGRAGIPAATVAVEGADADLGAVGRILRMEIGAVLGGSGHDQAEIGRSGIGGDYIMGAEDLRIFLEHLHHLPFFVIVPSERGQGRTPSSASSPKLSPATAK